MYKDLIVKSRLYNDELKEVLPKELGLRKKMGIFYAKDSLIFVISQKSRVLLKDTVKLEEILKKVEEFLGKEFENKTMIIDAPLCSKAKNQLEGLKWKIKV